MEAKEKTTETTKEIGKMSSKKRKRFEKYLQKKIKKEQRTILLEKLSKSSFSSELMNEKNTQQDLNSIVMGSALKRGPDGEFLMPVKKKKKKKAKNKFKNLVVQKKILKDEDSFDKESNEKRKSFKEWAREQMGIKENNQFKIQQSRMQLPIYGEEQTIMETINEHSVVIICGETGSGKTTQIPQFLYEAGYGNPENNPGIIGITQPRRVAAVSMSKRVAQELSLSEQEVSYQIRYDATTSPKTIIKFMTDGVLLRELANDFLLSKYSIIIIDEAHERNLNTDILIGVVSRVIRLRKELSEEDKLKKIMPLKIIIMSATLRVSDFTENRALFDVPPPVAIHFNKRTPHIDYITEAYKKICKIHTRLPHGGILVFLTGQNEISILCKKLSKKFPKLKNNNNNKEKEEDNLNEDKDMNNYNKDNFEVDKLDMDEDNQEEKEEEEEEKEESDNNFDTDSEEELSSDNEFDEFNEYNREIAPLHVLPLYSLLPTRAQLRVFESPPEGTRLCVIATNVAETSITIPGIKYVIDCGKIKTRKYDINTGIQLFEITWTSKASADQRAGRAGRTSSGHCYRLYSSAIYNDQFIQFSIPEINQIPIEGIILQMKSMNIDNVINFPFPTPPDRNQLRKAEMMLKYLGRIMSTFPIIPRYSKMLIIGQQYDCLPYIIAIVSAISELSEIQNKEIYLKERRKLIKKKFYEVQKKHVGLDPTSDLMKLLNVVGAYEYAGCTEKFCKENFVRIKAMQEIHKLRGQLTNIVNINCPDINICVDPKMKPPSKIQLKALQQIIVAGFIDQVAIRKDLIDNTTTSSTTTTTTTSYTSNNKTRNVAYQTMWSGDDVFIHPSSIISHYEKLPNFVVYQELYKSSNSSSNNCITIAEPSWLSKFGKSLCTFSKPIKLPIKNKEKSLFVTPFFGPKNWELPRQPIEIFQKL
ncbi:1263_t:CDS:10 [Diversispora eburnea]|uniref:RNA helicase n=1 Tax=Diversispora eburnea TaxID=1213867 RepID=A0A9N9ABP1_9GLOM|nr:1263_t:CDS:10 [Diversispora eburnea]